jgi:predicted RNase H-like nuclease (RuvC/YqgF family)
MTDWSLVTVDDLRKELVAAAKRLAPHYKIEAIRYYRCATNSSLRYSKDQVELWIKEFERDQEIEAESREGYHYHEGRLDDHTKLINTLYKQVDELSRANQERLDENISFEERFDRLEDRIERLEDLHSQVSDVGSRIDDVRNDLQYLESRVDGLENDGM